ncbi:MAG: carboxylating nicotinate-nucleotide diphosphorylase [Candidatus Krumholzibacteria bacterium]|nr:carboxylating nicotinate-nucleotide diphosphorylase [Candidatus Krumholzibacteria bacterium]
MLAAARAAVAAALDEDAATRDVTTRLLVPERLDGRAVVVARAGGVISGQMLASLVYERLGGARWTALLPDGSSVGAGDTIARVEGRLRALLSGERTALNFLGRLSGVATLTAAFVRAAAGSGVRILDTRKTTPGLRLFEKRAVADGGGTNHRADLASLILVKENHIAAAGGIEAVIDALGDRLDHSEIEVTGVEELRALSGSPPGRVMLDNFAPEDVVRAVEEISRWPRRPQIEVSGGVTLANVVSYAVPGVDFISVGSLTNSAPALDLSMLVEEIS